MNYEELQKEIASIVLQREALNAAMKTRLAEIVEFSEFKKGDKVRFMRSEKWEEAFIANVYYNSDYKKIVYEGKKCKKDGTQSQHDIWGITYAEKIEKL